MPGTVLKFSDGKKLSFNDNAKLLCNGEVNNLITLTCEDNYWGGIFTSSDLTSEISYTQIQRVFNQYPEAVLSKNGSGGFIVEHTIFEDNYFNGYLASQPGVEKFQINY